MERKRWCDAPGRSDAHYSLEKSYLLPDEVLKHRALPGTLSSDNGDLGKVQVRVLADGRESILHAVHQRNQVLHSPVAHLGDAPSFLSLVKPGMELFLFLPVITSTLAFTEGVWGCSGLTRRFSPSLTVRSPERTGPLLQRAPQQGGRG